LAGQYCCDAQDVGPSPLTLPIEQSTYLGANALGITVPPNLIGDFVLRQARRSAKGDTN
jgi:hypothetical protein